MQRVEVSSSLRMPPIKESESLASEKLELREVRTELVCPVLREHLAVHTYAMKDGRIQEWLFHLFGKSGFPVTVPNGAKFMQLVLTNPWQKHGWRMNWVSQQRLRRTSILMQWLWWLEKLERKTQTSSEMWWVARWQNSGSACKTWSGCAHKVLFAHTSKGCDAALSVVQSWGHTFSGGIAAIK